MRTRLTRLVAPGAARIGWYLLLALAVAGPLLGPGRLLLLDYVSGPSNFAPTYFPLPSSSDPGNGVPLLLLLHGLASVQALLPDKLLLLAPVALGGIGMDRLVRGRFSVDALAGLYAGTLWAVNPFVRDRFLAGHLFFLLGYGLLPFALATALDASGRPLGAGVRRGVWVALLAALDLHVALVYAALVLLFAPAVLRPLRRLGGTLAATGVVAALLSAYWLLPFVFDPPASPISRSDLSSFASIPRGPLVFPTLLSLHGFWRTEVVPLAYQHPVLFALLWPTALLALLGAEQLVRQRPTRRIAVVLLAAMAFALTFAGTPSVSGAARPAQWLFSNLPGMETFREPQKLVLVLVLGYAIFGATTLQQLTRRRRWVAPLAIACVLGYGGGLFWGFNASISLSHYPSGWQRARQIVTAYPGTVLVFPWHPYLALPFAAGRVVATTGRAYFGGDTLQRTGTGFAGAPETDPFAAYVSATLAHKDTETHFGAAMAPLGVRWIFLEHIDDWKLYRFLAEQRDLRPVLVSASATLYENAAWNPSGLRLHPAHARDDRRRALESGDGLDRLLIEQPALVGASRAHGLSALAHVVRAYRLDGPRKAPFVSLPLRCTDGWSTPHGPASCDLGAVAAFDAPQVRVDLVRPGDGLRLVGYLLTGSLLLLMGAWAGSVVAAGPLDRNATTQAGRTGAERNSH